MTVLDASALLAFVLEEPGADKVEDLLADGVLLTVNASEIARRLIRAEWEPEQCRRWLLDTQVRVVPFDYDLAIATAAIEPVTRGRGLSLGDRGCLALGMRLRRPVATADREWKGLEDALGIEVVLIR